VSFDWLTWIDRERQGAELRTGSGEAEDVLTDSRYDAALTLYKRAKQAAEDMARVSAEVDEWNRTRGD
jgi:hypothetical protein